LPDQKENYIMWTYTMVRRRFLLPSHKLYIQVKTNQPIVLLRKPRLLKSRSRSRDRTILRFFTVPTSWSGLKIGEDGGVDGAPSKSGRSWNRRSSAFLFNPGHRLKTRPDPNLTRLWPVVI